MTSNLAFRTVHQASQILPLPIVCLTSCLSARTRTLVDLKSSCMYLFNTIVTFSYSCVFLGVSHAIRTLAFRFKVRHSGTYRTAMSESFASSFAGFRTALSMIERREMA
jgi:ABC-type uncharacterized transport system permease subunit